LRFQMEIDELNIDSSNDDGIENMKNLIDKANEFNVEKKYLEDAEKLKSQMSGNKQAHDILSMMLVYPTREHPIDEPLDKKKKSLMKPKEDDKKKKKRKKKEAPFPIPAWATELEALIAQVNSVKSLIEDYENYKLKPEFVQEVNSKLTWFRNEIKFRSKQEEEARLEAEARKLKLKNKNKKKK